ncbi:Hpt domain-containing protein [Alteromonas sp. C1M14]|uniref:Hpt domain-containing protein n=1 Tax=Alteromonas sp. C1M14 TaxID=2841567 RepID=UPI001C0A13BC|nr:Hpt domain-containing protein [Alteromonas sp. C1M14]MBU2978062.1 Hpt domain-containing protein [Alteromonas sp. C1M14]
MDSAAKIIDLEFGLSQLSGNKTLFLRLLQKFADEYQDSEDKLNTMLRNEQWQEAKIHLHTIKGVAGNLGISRLHQACKQTEDELKANPGTPSSFSAFCFTLSTTLSYIDELHQTPSLIDAPPQRSPQATATSPLPTNESSLLAPEAFIQALEQSEFIAQDQLDEWLTETTSDPALQQSVRDAIDELDYDTALTLVRG